MTEPNQPPDIAPQAIPLLEYDPSRRAIIEPRRPAGAAPLPAHAVLAYFGDRIRDLAARGELTQVGEMHSEMGKLPLYVLERQGRQVVVAQPGIGGPFAAAFVDELQARGCQHFIVCGGCGVLDREVAVGHLLLPTHALRDEGASYHYLPPSRWAEPTPRALQALGDELAARELPYLRCKTWTTDAFYRETPAKVAMRRAEGCLCVEMEAASLFAAAQFRGVELAQVLYAGDDVSGQEWDHRDWNRRHDLRAELIYLAADAVLRL